MNTTLAQPASCLKSIAAKLAQRRDPKPPGRAGLRTAACEDWPCCGHEQGCCPDYDESGEQQNMKCTCGATVPLGSRSSLCPDCLKRMHREDNFEYDDQDNS